MSEKVYIGANVSVTGWVAKADYRKAGNSQLFEVTVPIKTLDREKNELYTAWYTAKAWKDKATALHQQGIKKGDKVTLRGKLSPQEYNGKVQFNVDFPEVDVIESKISDDF